MIKKQTCTESASPDNRRMLKYKGFAEAFSYPDDENLASEYDGLFRSREIWLYTTEYSAKNEFQRSNYLSDIMGFYKAFGLEPDKERPDSLSAQLEFMHYLIFKALYAAGGRQVENAKEKALICIDAQRKFFNDHLYPGAKRIAEELISKAGGGFYARVSRQMLKFLEEEKKLLGTGI